ncbi:MAG: hypothetical protein WBJ19_08560 [Rhodoferax sp.]
MFVTVAMATGTRWGAGVARHAMACFANSQKLRPITFIVADGALGIPLEKQILGRIRRHGDAAREYRTQDRASKRDLEKLLESRDILHAAIPLHFCRLTDQAFIFSR